MKNILPTFAVGLSLISFGDGVADETSKKVSLILGKPTQVCPQVTKLYIELDHPKIEILRGFTTCSHPLEIRSLGISKPNLFEIKDGDAPWKSVVLNVRGGLEDVK